MNNPETLPIIMVIFTIVVSLGLTYFSVKQCKKKDD